MKIINTDSKPFEWTFDGQIYGPLLPGQIGDYPVEIANHAVKRGVVLDDAGDFVRFRVEALDNMDKARIKDLAMYECPYRQTGECDAAPFKNVKDLHAHMESHLELSAEPLVVGKPTAPAQQAIRK